MNKETIQVIKIIDEHLEELRDKQNHFQTRATIYTLEDIRNKIIQTTKGAALLRRRLHEYLHDLLRFA